MPDISERAVSHLRLLTSYESKRLLAETTASLLADAVEEIGRLRLENLELHKAGCDGVERLQEENERLRDACKDVEFCLIGVIQFIRDVGRPDVAKMVETHRDILVSARRKK